MEDRTDPTAADLSELLDGVDRARRAEIYSDALSTITRVLFEEPDMKTVLDCVTSEGRCALGTESAVIDVLDDGELVARFISGLPDDVRDRRLDPELVPHVVAAVDTRAAVAIDDAMDSPMGSGLLDVLGVRSVLTVPLYVLGELLGFLSFSYHDAPHVWSPSEIDFANKLSATASLAVESIRAREDLLASERRNRATFDSAAVGIANSDLDGRWTRVNDKLCDFLGRSREELLCMSFRDVTFREDLAVDEENAQALLNGEIRSYSMEKRYFRPDGTIVWGELSVSLVRDAEQNPAYFIRVIEDITARKLAEAELAAVREQADLLTRLLAESRQPFAAGTQDGFLLMFNEAFCELTGYSAEELEGSISWATDLTPPEWRGHEAAMMSRLLETGSPVRYRKEYVRKDGSRVPVELFAHVHFTDSGDMRLFAFVTDVSSRMLAERTAELSAVLNEIDAKVNQTSHFDESMSEILADASRALGVDTAAVTLLHGDYYEITNVYGFPEEYVGNLLDRDDLPHAELAVTTRDTVAIDDAENDLRTKHEVIKAYGVKSVMVVPLVRADRVYGAIFFNHAKAPVVFTPPEVDFVTKLGYHLSLAADNARLFNAKRVVAETLQEALLTVPSSIDGIEFGHQYQSASSVARVGGDFYDLFPLEDGRVAMLLGDVAGKGLEAAVFTSRAKAYLRAESGIPGRTPAQVFKRVNEVLVRETLEESFFTVFLGFLDPASGRLEYASAGHTTTGLIKPSGAVHRLPSTGPILGAFANLQFRDAEAVVGPRDIVFAYTDGLIEARMGHGEMFGEQRLFERLSARATEEPQALVQHVVEDVVSFAQQLRDDVAVLAVRRAAAGAELGAEG